MNAEEAHTVYGWEDVTSSTMALFIWVLYEMVEPHGED